MIKHKVVLVPFPFDDLSATKVRPAVCLTNAIGPYQHVVLAFITSQVPQTLVATDILIDVAAADFAATGLRVTSTLQLHRLTTVKLSVLRRDLGILPTRLQTELQARLRQLFDLQ